MQAARWSLVSLLSKQPKESFLRKQVLKHKSSNCLASIQVKKCSILTPNGDKVSNVDIVYICHEYTGELKMQASEVSQLKFIDICDLPEDIFPPNRPAIEDYINKNKT